MSVRKGQQRGSWVIYGQGPSSQAKGVESRQHWNNHGPPIGHDCQPEIADNAKFWPTSSYTKFLLEGK